MCEEEVIMSSAEESTNTKDVFHEGDVVYYYDIYSRPEESINLSYYWRSYVKKGIVVRVLEPHTLVGITDYDTGRYVPASYPFVAKDKTTLRKEVAKNRLQSIKVLLADWEEVYEKGPDYDN
jgi:hypothetical protein